ncbi:hypothetical protein FPHYL_4885 [Fusarium phyllophilum]|uniref:Uncharacterized protein n=1 Tax=Fusarium phyllophilum TaxID=47803 RepID=A0A8H5NET9_9HYPO|nr:hypothetical protein FPHYL_4885 [Fusarium phyllophilum]
MSSPLKDKAGLNTPPKNNSPENIAPNIEALPEADQKVEAPKLLKQEQKVPNGVTLPHQGRLKRHRSTQESEPFPQPKRARGLGTPLTDATPQDPDKELELLIEEELRIVRSLSGEGEREHLHKLSRARAREDMKKHTKHPQETKTQEPTVGTQEDVKEGSWTDDAVPPRN